MRRFIAIFLPILLFSLGVQAQVTTDKGANFVSLNRKVAIVAPAYEDMEVIEDLVRGHGAKITSGFFAKLFNARITCKEVASIDDSDNAFSVDVNKSSIFIYYTNVDMREKALKAFAELFQSPYGQKVILGKYVEQILPSLNTKGGRAVKKSRGDVVFDGVTHLLPTASVVASIKQSSGSKFIMAVVSKRIFRFNFTVFNGWNSVDKAIAADGAYSSAQMAQFVKAAAEKGVAFVPAIDLLSHNEVFEAYTGHKMSSVEGMRFVRSIVEQCAREWRVKKICIGRKSTVIDCRYKEFLADLALRENIEFISL